MSEGTAKFFKEVLGSMSLPALDPEIERQASRVAQARREIDEALEHHRDHPKEEQA